MRHKMLTQHALFCIDSNTKKGTLSQQFVTHVAPPLELHAVFAIGVYNFLLGQFSSSSLSEVDM